jgi:ABC-type multidrug transport system ATPase subunit
VFGYRITGVTGSVILDGKERNMDAFRRLSCYITQDDRLQPLLTVRENMQIAGDLKLSGDVSRKEKDNIVSIINPLFCTDVELGF